MMVAGAVVMPAVLVIAGLDKAGRVGPNWRDGPGELVLNVQRPGEQMIWHERGYRDGLVFRAAVSERGRECPIRVIGPSGAEVTLRRQERAEIELGPIRRECIGVFDAGDVGVYRIAIGDLAQGEAATYRFSASESIKGNLTVLVIVTLIALLVGMVLVTGGMVLAIWTVYREITSFRRRSRPA